jgi:dGTP triphosphohydrolase
MYQAKSTDFLPYLSCLENKALGFSKGRSCTHHEINDTDDSLYNVVDPFLLDIRKIDHCKASRRLQHKAQVFCLPENTHIRTRHMHTVEVTSDAKIIAYILGLNKDLCEAISLGHDIGHAPFGHIGEEYISKLAGKAFRHNIFSTVIAQEIERNEFGLRLCHETLEGIFHHSSGSGKIETNRLLPQEYAVVKYADKIAYTFSDINDGIRYGYLQEESLPLFLNEMGRNQRIRETNAIFALVKESAEKGYVSFSESEFAQKFEQLKLWMYDHFYHKLDRKIFFTSLEVSFDFLSSEKFFEDYDPLLLLACLTDKEAKKIVELTLAHRRIKISDIDNFGIMEILPNIKGRKINIFAPCL